MRTLLPLIAFATLGAAPQAAPFVIAETGQGFKTIDDAVTAVRDGTATILIAPGVYEVQPGQELETGEYGFLYSASTGGGVGVAGVGAMTSRIFDFSIQ